MAIVNLTSVILKTFWSIHSRLKWTGNLVLGGTEGFAGTLMSFQMGIGSLGRTVFPEGGLVHLWKLCDFHAGILV